MCVRYVHVQLDLRSLASKEIISFQLQLIIICTLYSISI